MRFDALSRKIPDAFWYRRTVSEGTNGPITYEFTKRRVTLCKDGLPTRTVWLVMKRSLEHTKCWFFISNAPLSTKLSTFVWLSGIRWAVEQCFEESKGEVGMNHYEVRKYPAWNHHILTSMLAHFFLWHLRIRLGKKAPLITLSQLRMLIMAVLPMKTFDAEALIRLVQWIEIRNHRAYLSHRKKKLEGG